MKVIIQVKADAENKFSCHGCVFDGYDDNPCCQVGSEVECDNDSIYKAVEASEVIGINGKPL